MIFLGGTSGGNRWRAAFARRLAARGVPAEILFDPVVADWNEAARRREERVKRKAALLVFYLGNPRQKGLPLSAFSLAEAALALCRDSRRTLVVFDHASVRGHARKVYEQTEKLFRKRKGGAHLFKSLAEAQDWIVKHFAKRGGRGSRARR